MITVASSVVAINPEVATVLGCGPKNPIVPTASEKLEANIVLLGDSTGNKVLVVSVDALYIGPGLRTHLESVLSPSLKPHEIFVAATHTHNAPQLDDTKPKLGLPVPQHFHQVAFRIAEAAKELLGQAPCEVRVFSRRYRVKSVVRRRWRRPVTISRAGIGFFDIQALRNPRTGKITSEVIEFVDQDKNLMALVWIMPCHPTSFPDPRTISPHFIGEVRQRIRAKSGSEEIPVVFLQGASGDIRPPAYRAARFDFSEHLRRVLRGKIFDSFSESQYRQWVEKVFREFDSGRAMQNWKATSSETALVGSSHFTMRLNEAYDFEYSNPRFFTCHVLQIAGLKIIGVSAEPTWKMRQSLLQARPQTTLVGCIDDTFGYLPTPREFETGGYEASGFLSSFSLESVSAEGAPSLIGRFVKDAIKTSELEI